MELMYERVAGLDVHQKSVTVTVRVPDRKHPGRRVEKTRQFSTYYQRLLDLARWLVESGVTHAAMESAEHEVHPRLVDVRGPELYHLEYCSSPRACRGVRADAICENRSDSGSARPVPVRMVKPAEVTS